MKTLLNTYCIIETHEHVKALAEHQSWVTQVFIGDAIAMGENLDKHDFDAFDPEDLPHRTRVTVERYIDMMTDRITPWRLEGSGFDSHPQGLPRMAFKTRKGAYVIVVFHEHVVDVYVKREAGIIPFEGITNFSELQTLIKFLTPKP